MADLKPCPFCDHSAALESVGADHFVMCDGCCAETARFQSPAGDNQRAIEHAIDAWNRRAASPADQDEPSASPDALTDERVFELVGEVLGQPLIVEDLRQGFAVHTEPRDWLNFARALLAASPADPRMEALAAAEKHVEEAAARRVEREAKWGIAGASPAALLTDEQIDGYWESTLRTDRLAHQKFARAILNAGAVQVRTEGFRDCIDAIKGAIAFGQRDRNPAPDGHWLAEFWEIGRRLAASPADQGEDASLPELARTPAGQRLYSLAYYRGRMKGRKDAAMSASKEGA